MRLPRRTLLRLLAGAAVPPAAASAQAYPSRPVRIIIGFAAAGAFDITARLIAQRLSDRFGQPFIVENRPGAGTNLATEAVVRASPDGHTLLLAGAVNAVNATLYEKLKFDFVKDIAPVAGIIRFFPTSWRSTQPFRPKAFRSSSPMPRPTPERSRLHRPAPGARSISRANCSR